MMGKSQKTAQQNPATSKIPVPTSQANAASATSASKDAMTEATAEVESSVEVLSAICSM